MKTSGRVSVNPPMISKPLLRLLIVATVAVVLAGISLADTLELKNGQIVQGQFVGGSPLNIRFRVNGQEQVFATKDVLNIGFSDTTDTDASNATAAPQPAPAPADTPAPDAAAAPAATNTVPASSAPSAPPPSSAQQQNVQQNTQSGTATTQAITIPAGTSVLVRMVDGVDSSTNKIGDPFHGSLESALVVGNTVVAPKGSDAYGKLTQAKEAGKISGSAQLTLELTGIRINGNIVPVDSTDYDVAGKGRGTQSAERIGGGAVAGAIIGGILGGGKGAAVGATLGAGGGTAVQVMTHGDQVRIPSETLLEFKLQQDVTAPISTSN